MNIRFKDKEIATTIIAIIITILPNLVCGRGGGGGLGHSRSFWDEVERQSTCPRPPPCSGSHQESQG